MATFPYYRTEAGPQGSLATLSLRLPAGVHKALDSDSRPCTITVSSTGEIRAWRDDDPTVSKNAGVSS